MHLNPSAAREKHLVLSGTLGTRIKGTPSNRPEMMASIRSHLRRRQRQPQVIQKLFQEKHVRYAD